MSNSWNLTRITKSIFIGDLTELLTEVVSSPNSIIILQDINIHLNEPEDTDAKALCDIFEAFNITQYIKSPTHNLGHTLEIIATEIRQNRNFTTIQGPYISDHQLITTQLEDKKPKNRINEIEYRRITDETIQEFKERFKNQPILDAQTLEKAVCQLDNQVQNALEEVTPLFTKKIKAQEKPWYDKQLNDQGKMLKIEKENA